ncbi:MAG: phenylalanine--tRNA ligase subunit beta [Candidatus Omnitrophica bacterium]|nr:phenylalanine--tRNA ligase subunit beta [Candidatus Omnitrophota bacterium]
MKVSLEWLKEFVSIRLPTASLVDQLAMGGLEVIAIEKKGRDTLLEIEITPNRPDLLSHIGIAREIAALTGVSMKLPKQPATGNRKTHITKLPLRISIQDRSGCIRYMGRLFEHVQVGPTPPFLKDPLERLGFRSINNVVDITNYVLLEMGQPLHAFDGDRIEGGEIIIRSARRGETLLAIDGTNYSLREEDLVIADAKKPIALAGVIGGKETEVGPTTKRILLESAFFNSVRVRRTSKRLGVTTESSYRFERGVSLEGVQEGSERAHAFLSASAGAAFVSPLIDQGRRGSSTKRISISLQGLNETLGVSMPPQRVKSFLSSLGCRVAGQRLLHVIPPHFRKDLQIPVDLVEEVGRLLGYDKIPVTTPPMERTPLEQRTVSDAPERSLEEKVKMLLVSQGLFEAVTYSLLSKGLLKTFFGDRPIAIPIRNPISLEQELLRPSLAPRLVEAASYNFRRKSEGVSFFELGSVYEKEGNRYRERKSLAIFLAGKDAGTWKTKPSSYDYFDLKGRCELLLKTFCPFIEIAYRSASLPFFSAGGLSVELLGGGKKIGILGELSTSIVSQFDLKGRAYVAELNFSEFSKIASLSKRVLSVPKHPSVRRDIALIADRSISSEELVKTMREQGGEGLSEVSLFDTYSDPRIVPEGSRGLAYRIEFLHPDRSLTDEEVNEKYRSILEALKKKGVQIRST